MFWLAETGMHDVDKHGLVEINVAASTPAVEIIGALQVDCVEDFEEIQLILMECNAQFDSINFFFGGDDFSFTVRSFRVDWFARPGVARGMPMNSCCSD